MYSNRKKKNRQETRDEFYFVGSTSKYAHYIKILTVMYFNFAVPKSIIFSAHSLEELEEICPSLTLFFQDIYSQTQSKTQIVEGNRRHSAFKSMTSNKYGRVRATVIEDRIQHDNRGRN